MDFLGIGRQDQYLMRAPLLGCTHYSHLIKIVSEMIDYDKIIERIRSYDEYEEIKVLEEPDDCEDFNVLYNEPVTKRIKVQFTQADFEYAFNLSYHHKQIENGKLFLKLHYDLYGTRIKIQSDLFHRARWQHDDLIEATKFYDIFADVIGDDSVYELFTDRCIDLSLPFFEWLYNLRQINDEVVTKVFEKMCDHGLLEKAIWLYEKGVNIDLKDIFRYNKHLPILKWLYSLDESYYDSETRGEAFLNCRIMEIIKWLISIGGFDIDRYKNDLFISAYHDIDLKEAQYFYEYMQKINHSIDIRHSDDALFKSMFHFGIHNKEKKEWLCQLCDAYELTAERISDGPLYGYGTIHGFKINDKPEISNPIYQEEYDWI